MKIRALAKLENVTGNLSKETGNFCTNWQLFQAMDCLLYKTTASIQNTDKRTALPIVMKLVVEGAHQI